MAAVFRSNAANTILDFDRLAKALGCCTTSRVQDEYRFISDGQTKNSDGDDAGHHNEDGYVYPIFSHGFQPIKGESNPSSSKSRLSCQPKRIALDQEILSL